jgi:hypothetical protein
MQHIQNFFLFESGPIGSLIKKQQKLSNDPENVTESEETPIFRLSPEQEEFLNSNTSGSWSFNEKTGLVDIEGSFYCEESDLDGFMGIKFGIVRRNFVCRRNKLTSLAGAPWSVRGVFDCSANQLTSLEGGPTKCKDYICVGNNLKNLAGFPQELKSNFECSDNPFVSWSEAPAQIESSGKFAFLQPGKYSCYFYLKFENWNFVGFLDFLETENKIDPYINNLIFTLPFFNLPYWMDLLQKNRYRFNQQWLKARKSRFFKQTEIFKKIEDSLPSRVKKNLDDLEDLQDFS